MRQRDWDAVYPVHQVRLRVSSTARVYQVDSAADWHRLVQRYGDWATRPGSDDSHRDFGSRSGLARWEAHPSC